MPMSVLDHRIYYGFCRLFYHPAEFTYPDSDQFLVILCLCADLCSHFKFGDLIGSTVIRPRIHICENYKAKIDII